jgi:Fe-S cluster assembly protein SufD
MFESSQSNSPSSLIAGVDAVKRERWQDAPEWLTAVRDEGRRLFEQQGLPNRRNEEWKYTDVSSIAAQTFSTPAPLETDGTEEVEQAAAVENPLSPLRLVFINGFYSSSLSRLTELPDGVEAGSLAAALTREPVRLRDNLAAYAAPSENSFVALNNAFLEDGAFIYISPGVRLAQPLHLVYITTGSVKHSPGVHHPRNMVIAGEGSDVIVIEDYINGDGTDAVYFNNPVTEIVVGRDARVEHYKLQREGEHAFHIATIQAVQEKGSSFSSHSLSIGGRLTRNNIHSVLNGVDSTCTLNGLYMIHGRQHVDNHTLIFHNSPDCSSRELYHGILDDRARGVFNGKIYVVPEAQKTDSQQTNRSLMLSDGARVDAKPQLEIFADDVKCTHGATVGKLDDDALYYLRSRGIGTAEARKMLTLAFAQRVTALFPFEPLRKAMESLIAHRLG